MSASARETMRVLPGFLQPFLTWLTGMPFSDQQPLVHWTAGGRAIYAVATTSIGIGLGICIFNGPPVDLLCLPVSWLLTTSGMRDLYAVIEHYCIHNSFSSSRLANRIVGELISTTLLAAPYDLFRHDHLTHHHTTRTDDDPDVRFLRTTGFRRGMTRAEFRRYILLTSLSPWFHLKYLASRLKWNFTAPPYRVAITVLYLGGVAWSIAVTGGLVEWLVVFAFPAVIPFQVASLINYHSEHRWLDHEPGLGRIHTARVCVGRFCGDPAPQISTSNVPSWLAAWGVWWTRVLFVHLPYRLFVLVGDQSQHDLHHRRPGSDWANAAYARRDDILKGCQGWPEGYSDVWGTMLDHLDACIEDPFALSSGSHAGAMTIGAEQGATIAGYRHC